MSALARYLFKAGSIISGSDKDYSLNGVAGIVKRISKEFGFSPSIEHAEERHEVKNAFCNHEKAKLLLGFEDKTNLKETIKEMFVWAMKQEDREVKQMDYEIDKGMYSYWK